MLELLRRVEYKRRIYRRRMMGNYKDLGGSCFALAMFAFASVVIGTGLFPPVALLGPLVGESLVVVAIVCVVTILLAPLALLFL